MFQLLNTKAPSPTPTSWNLRYPFALHDEHVQRERKFVNQVLRGHCPICGHSGAFTAFSENVRESGTCSKCGSTNRQRLMAMALLQCTGLSPTDGLSSLSSLRIHNTESGGPLHQQLIQSPQYTFSEFFGPEFVGGTYHRGIRHENLTALSFSDESIDVMLSSDVMEHMPDPYQGHRDIFRVLKHGGRHVFTVPFYPWEVLDDKRARIVGETIEYYGEKLYHGDPVRPDEGILVWTIFGLEMLVRLAEIGFQPRVWEVNAPEYGIVGSGCYVFDAYKP